MGSGVVKEIRDDRLLDNVIWHALRGPLARFVSRDPGADFLRFDPEVNVFGAIDRIDDPGWMRIAERVGPGGHCGLFRDEVPAPPAGWEELFRAQCLQMVAADLVPASDDLAISVLGDADRMDMLALAELTEPGPFFERTSELGRYVGIREGGRLLAMAGERLRVPGFVEISAVCTHPDARGRGLAGELTLDVARSIRATGDEAFLHVIDTNESAVRLYEKLGFVVRRRVDVVFAQFHQNEQ